MKHFKAIAALAENRVIGAGARIPWHLPEDFRWFKKTTMGHILIMGRKTFESIGRPLPGRETIVLSRTAFEYPGVRTVKDLASIDPSAEARTVFICGGGMVYAEALPLCDELFLTHVKRNVEGDVYFPPFEDRFAAVESIAENEDFRIVRYRNRQMNLNDGAPEGARR